MKLAQMFKYAWLFALILTLSCRNGLSNEQTKPTVIVKAAAQLQSAAVERVEYYYLPERELTQHAIEPDSLVSDAPYKATLGEVSTRFLSEIAEAMQSSTYESDSTKGDMRFGVILYNTSGEKMLSIFFDQSRTRAIINDASFRVTGNLRETLFRRIKCLVE
ncbi:MAG TPA: hypothetical protein VFR24_26705 [Candidatus Angelobacter sp.]|nr:hypothetical protein [Candidatus Angelobacter sp.]